MEGSLQKEVLAGKNENNLVHLVLIDKVANKSIMVGVDKVTEAAASSNDNCGTQCLRYLQNN